MTKMYVYLFSLWFMLGSLACNPYSATDGKVDAAEGISIERVNEIQGIARGYYPAYPDSAEIYVRKALVLSRELKYLEGTANSLNMLGVLSKNKEEPLQAMNYYLEALEIQTLIEDWIGEAKTYQNIGVLLLQMEKNEEALSYYEKALPIYLRHDETYLLAGLYNNIGNVHIDLGNSGKAQAFFMKSQKIYKEMDDPLGIAHTLNNLAGIYNSEGKFSKALACDLEALELREGEGDKQGMIDSYLNAGISYKRLKRPKKALEYFQKGLGLANEISPGNDKALLLLNIHNAYDSLGNATQSLDYFRKYSVLSDSLTSLNKDREVARVLAEFEKGKIERELSLKEEALAREKLTRLLLISIVVILSLLVVSSTQLIQSYKKQKKATVFEEKRKEELNQQNLLRLLKDHQLELLDATLEGMEQERLRTARDLHDSLGGTLAAVKAALFTLDNKLEEAPEGVRKAFENANSLFGKASKDARRIVHNMADFNLQNMGLVDSVQEMCDKLNSSNTFDLGFESSGLRKERLDNTMEINIYRIIQELFQNIIKHADASKVSLQLNQINDGINILLEDDGVGFDPDSEHFQEGMGLANISARTHKLNGTCKIYSTPGQGTTINIDIPL